MYRAGGGAPRETGPRTDPSARLAESAIFEIGDQDRLRFQTSRRSEHDRFSTSVVRRPASNPIRIEFLRQ